MKLTRSLLLVLVIVSAACVSKKGETCTFVTSQSSVSNRSAEAKSDAELISAVDVVDNYAYIGVGNELLILNVADPADVTQVGGRLLSGGIESLEVIGEYVYTRGGKNHIVDVADPVQPRIVECQQGSTIPSLAGGIFADGFAYVPSQEDGKLEIYEVARDKVARVATYQSIVPARVRLLPDPRLIPSEPRIVIDVAVTEKYVYVAENRAVAEEGYFQDGRIQVLDVSVPSQPRSVGMYVVPGGAAVLQIIAHNDSLVVSTGGGPTAATRLLDISEAEDPTETEVVHATESLLGISNDYALFKYIEAGIPGIRTRRLADINQSSDWDESSWVYAIAADVGVVRDYAYFVGGGPAMAIVDVTDPRIPILAGTFSYLPGEVSE